MGVLEEFSSSGVFVVDGETPAALAPTDQTVLEDIRDVVINPFVGPVLQGAALGGASAVASWGARTAHPVTGKVGSVVLGTISGTYVGIAISGLDGRFDGSEALALVVGSGAGAAAGAISASTVAALATVTVSSAGAALIGIGVGAAAYFVGQAFGLGDYGINLSFDGSIVPDAGPLYDHLRGLQEHFGTLVDSTDDGIRLQGQVGIQYVEEQFFAWDLTQSFGLSFEISNHTSIIAGVAFQHRYEEEYDFVNAPDLYIEAELYQEIFELSVNVQEYGDLVNDYLKEIGTITIIHENLGTDYGLGEGSPFNSYQENITYIGRDDPRYSNSEQSEGFEPGHYVDPDNGWELSIQDPDDEYWSPPELHTFSTPIVIDLNGDGLVGFVSIEQSDVYFDIDDDGFLENTAWIGIDEDTGLVEDGFLVADRNGDGDVQGDELALANLTSDPSDTDLEALAVLYDSNLDGVINAADAGFNELRVWRDADLDGEVDSGELMTLAEIGLTEINVDAGANGSWVDVSDLTDAQLAAMGWTSDDVSDSAVPGVVGQEAIRFDGSVALFGLTAVTINGEQRLALDAGIGHQVEGRRQLTTPSGDKRTEWEDGRLTLEVLDPGGIVLDMSVEGYDAAYGGDGADVIRAGYSEDGYGTISISGGGGDDSLIGAAGTDILTGGEGADTLVGDAGDDILFIDAEDIAGGSIDGGEGADTAFVTGWQEGEPGVTVILSDHALEAVHGNDGNDSLSAGVAPTDSDGEAIGAFLHGGKGDDNLAGAAGADLLVGEDGDDTVLGDAGDDLLLGDAGADTLSGGGDNDILDGGVDDDVLSGDAGEDTIYVGLGNDTVSGGSDADVFVYQPGDGNDTITDFEVGVDRIELTLTAEADVTISADGADTLITIQLVEGTDTIRLVGIDPANLADGDILFGLIDGTENSDVSLDGDRSANLIVAKEGDDSIAAGGASDTVFAGAGNDTVDGGEGSDQIFGDGGNDDLVGGLGDDEIDGGAGDDTVDGGAGLDLLIGGTGNDSLDGGDDQDALFAGSGHDTVGGGAGDDAVDAGTGDDLVTGGAGKDVLSGGVGADTLQGGTENDSLAGGAGDDSLSGDDGDDALIGGLGNDTAAGGSGADVFRFETGDGDDVITDFETGVDRIELWHVSSDSVTVTADGADVVVDTGDGTLRVLNASVADVAAALDFVHQTGTGSNDALTGHDGVNILFGEAGADTLAGQAGDDALSGGAGADSLDGGDGDDRLEGGADNDALTGGGGEDGFVFEANGGDDVVTDFVPGEDLLVFRGLSRSDLTIETDPADSANTRIVFTGGSVILVGVAVSAVAESDLGFIDTSSDNWSNTIVGSLEGDALSGGYGGDGLYGDAGNDTLDGGDGNDLLQGELGNDALDGGAGNDGLSGGRGADLLDGGEGNDVLEGGRDSDTLTGGEGSDLYVFTEGDGNDTITDFVAADDRLSFAVADPSTVSVSVAGGDTVVSYGAGGDQVTLAGVELPDLLSGGQIVSAGTDDTETLDGTVASDVVEAGEGDDTAYGGKGNDLVSGGVGNDTIYGDRNQAGGADSWQLVIKASGDHYQGAPIMEVTIDGVAYPLIEVTEVYGQDETGTYVIEVSDNFDPSEVTIKFTNDAWGGSPETDRNLIIHEIWVDGQPVDPSAISNTPPGWDPSWNDPNDGLFARLDRGDFAVAVDLSEVQPNRDDLLFGGEGDDLLVSDYGNNLLDGGSGSDSLEGGSDGDTLIGDQGSDTLKGNDGADYLDGGADEDSLSGGGENDILTGGGDSDTLDGGEGDDLLVGGLGDDSMTGGAGADLYVFSAGKVETGDDADDTVTYTVSDQRFEVIDGRLKLKSTESLDYETESTVTVTVTGTDAEGLSTQQTFVISVQDLSETSIVVDTTITGTNGGEKLYGTVALNEEILGLGGNDSLYGDTDDDFRNDEAGSNDILDGGDGNDRLYGDAKDGMRGDAIGGDDELMGGEGDDSLYGDSDRSIEGSARGGNDTLDGGAGDDRLYGDAKRGIEDNAVGGDDVLNGGDGADSLYGDSEYELRASAKGGDDTLDGGANDDKLWGDSAYDFRSDSSGGSDLLMGGDGQDTIYGDAPYMNSSAVGGDDTLIGGKGDDQLWGNSGADVFVVDDASGDDTIKDFEQGTDLIRVDQPGLGFGDLTITDNGNYRLVQVGASSIAVHGLASGVALTAADFEFSDETPGGDPSGQIDIDENLTGAIIATLDVPESSTGIVIADGDGHDTITDFDIAEDTLSISVDDPSAVSVSVVDGNTVVSYGPSGDKVTLAAVELPDLLSSGQMEIVSNGTDGDDSIEGSAAVDFIYAGTGNDTLRGRGTGEDYLDGGQGDDVVDGDEGDDTLIGGFGDDSLYGENGADQLIGGDGDDYLIGHNDDDTLVGDVGVDTLEGEAGDDLFEGGSGNDLLTGGSGSDLFAFSDGDGDDTITDFNVDEDQLVINVNDPSSIGVSVSGGNTVITYGADGDRVTLQGITDSTNVQVQWNGDADDNSLTGSPLADVVRSGSGDDGVAGGAGHDYLEGEEGDDHLNGGTDNDAVFGGAGIDTLYGLQGNDFLDGGDGNDRLDGGDDDDTLVGGAGVDTLYGAGGNDTLDGGESSDSLAGGSGNDALFGGAGVDTLYGQDGNDFLDGGDSDDKLVGGKNNDTLVGSAGVDSLWGEAGNDLLEGGRGNDSLMGGIGSDVYWFALGDGSDTINDFHTNEDRVGFSDVSVGDLLVRDAGDDVFVEYGAGDKITLQNKGTSEVISNVFQTPVAYSEGNQWHIGTSAANYLDTVTNYARHDAVFAGDGNDTLVSGAGNDLLVGGRGNDSLYGGTGNDLLYGGAGSDLFSFYSFFGNDVIGDFEKGVDQIRFQNVVFESYDITNHDGYATVVFSLFSNTVATLVVNGLQSDQSLMSSDLLFT